jgi:hypothetical protein
VLVEANVWKPGTKKHATNLLSKPGQQVPKGWPTPAGGLTAADFHVFDNGIERKINFLKELDFDARTSGPWLIRHDANGAWGTYNPPYLIEAATATYLIGFPPPSLQPGECRSVSIVVQGHDVNLNRTQYCVPEVPSKAAMAATEREMKALLDSQPRRPIKLSIRAFSFWSSGVLRLLTDPTSQRGGQVEPGSEYTYVVQVHDSKAPATVQIAAEFQWRNDYWETTDCFKTNSSVHILGTVYKANGEVETQFKDSISCLSPAGTESTPWKYGVKHGWFAHTVRIPTRFDTQVKLPPGSYELQVSVTDGTFSGQTRIPLYVQAFDGNQLTISDVVLGGILQDASRVPREAASVYPAPINPTPLVSKHVQFFPAIDADMPRHTPVSLYFEIYDPPLETNEPAIYYNVKITDLRTNTLVMNTGPMSAADWVLPENAVIPIGLQLDIEKLKAGTFRLEVRASDAAGRQTPWRQATFTIQ